MRSWPCAARALSNAAFTFSSDVTSTSQNIPPISLATCSPRPASRSNTATFAPRRASSRAVASPSPDAAPVTTAATPLMSMQVPLLAVRAAPFAPNDAKDKVGVGLAWNAGPFQALEPNASGRVSYGLQEDRPWLGFLQHRSRPCRACRARPAGALARSRQQGGEDDHRPVRRTRIARRRNAA